MPAESPTVSISWTDDCNSAERLDSEFDSEHNSDVHKCTEYNVYKPYCIVVGGNEYMQCGGDDEEEDADEEDG